METLRELAERYRVPIRKNPGDGSDSGCEIVRGKFGHLCQDGSKLLMVFSDDGAKILFTGKRKSRAWTMVKTYVKDLRQDGDAEFIAEIDRCGFPAVLKVLAVRQLKRTAGVRETDPAKLAALSAARIKAGLAR